jgi:hypothetical protein
MNGLIEKHAVEIIVPALGKKIEFLIPEVMDMSVAQGLIQKMVTDQLPEKNALINNTWLVDMESRRRIPTNATCSEAGLKNGSRLMLLWVN